MERDHLREVRLAQGVPVQREEARLELAPREPDRASRAERLVLDRVLQRHAVVLRSERGLDLIGEVPARDDRLLDAVPREVLERVGEQGAVDEREHVLADPVGEGSQPRALPAHEDDGRQAHGTGRPMPS